MSTLNLIDVKQAVRSVIIYFNDLQNILSLSHSIRDLRLEEVELVESQWLITLGYSIPKDDLGMQLVREYKIFMVDAETGDVTAMKIREL
jgi:hypothetical protein